LQRFLHLPDNWLSDPGYTCRGRSNFFFRRKKKMIRKILALTATALPVLAFALTPSSARAQSFTGNYAVSVTETECGIAGNIKCANQTYCLELTDDGDFGRAHSGPATLESSGSSPLSGTFQVIGKMITATFGVGSDTGEDDSVVLVAPANTGTGAIGIGIYDLAAGESEATGLATFGAKNSCSN
jgi:hypothetical protein